MPIENSEGELRPQNYRPDELPTPPVAALAAPIRDPHSGQFVPGNPGGRLRQLKALSEARAGELIALDPAKVAPWLRPHVAAAQDHARALVAELVVQSERLNALVLDFARVRFLAQAALAEGAREDCDPETSAKWREEALRWLREVRQLTLTVTGLEREEARLRAIQPGADDDLERRVREAAKRRRT
jgi:hypothetical protein